MRFSSRRGAVTADVSDVEATVLASAVVELVQLLGAGDAVPDDPLAAMVGLPQGEVVRPDDPALARLLPDGYRPDASDADGFDAEQAAADFRRYTQGDLRAGKRDSATRVLRDLVALGGGEVGSQVRGGRLRLDRDAADAWLLTLNDLRLVLGTRLEVTDDGEPGRPLDDEAAYAHDVYDWLGGVQEGLLRCLSPRPDGGAG